MTPELLPGELAPTIAEKPPGPPPRPKLRRNERQPDPGRWRDVIPPLVAEQIADNDALERHRELVGRVEVASAKLRELQAAHAGSDPRSGRRSGAPRSTAAPVS